MKKRRPCGIIFLCFTMIVLLAGGISIGHVKPVYAEVGMTRAEWIHNLTVVFDMSVDEENYSDNYYCDISAADSNYRDIMIATEFGVIDVEAGKEFQPNEALTRDFAAHTLNYCLGFQRQDESYIYSDVEDVPEQYRDDVQTAIERGWFVLVNGAFVPSKAVTSSETAAMLNDAKAWLAATKIDKNHDNSFTYESGFLEIPDGIEVEAADDGKIIIRDTSISIDVGDKFVIYQSGLPQAFQAKTVTSGEDALVISAEPIDNSEAIKTADAQGVAEGDLGMVVPAEGVDIHYEEEEEAAPLSEFALMNFQMQKSMVSRMISNKKKIKSISLSKKIGGNFTVQAKLSGLSVEYRVDGLNDIYVAVMGDAKITGTGSFSNSGTDSILLGSINVGGIADVTIRAKVLVTGKIVITYGTDFTAGVHYTSGKFRLVRDFHKKSFTIASEIKMTTGLEVSVNVNKIPGIRGKIYAEIGAKTSVSSKVRPGGKPAMCMHIFSYMYAEAGASVTVGAGVFSKTFSQKAVIFNAKNSPVRVVWHYEDGVLTNGCSVEPDENYYTGVDSRYGINSSGYGVGEGGELIPIFTYTLDDDGNATITGYKGNSYMVAIPDEIDGHPVVAIGRNAFKGNNSFSEVVVPEGVETIEWGAFDSCIELTKVTLPESLTLLDNHSFSNCTSLTEINIPSKVKTGNLAGTNDHYAGPFYKCESLEQITFNEGITTIPSALFHYCTGLKTIRIPDTVTTIEGSAFKLCSNLQTVELPDSLATIGWGAFDSCIELTKVTLPESLTLLDNHSFSNCTSLTEINIPSKVKTGNLAGTNDHYAGPFYKCESLEQITFNEGITTIPSALFHYCTGLETIRIPDTVTTIEGSAFKLCSNLQTVELPDSLATIGWGAFDSCIELTKVTLPESLTLLDNHSFSNCTSLTEINIPSKVKTGNLAGRNDHYAGPFYKCESLEQVTFNKGITIIPSALFHYCTGLKNITIPDTIMTIEGSAFLDCTSLTEINIPDTVKNALNGDTFAGCTSLKKVHIPENLTRIAGGTFKGCISLEEVNLPNTLLAIDGYAFENCDALEEVIFPADLQLIENSAYYGCSALKKVTFPKKKEGTISVKNRAFGKCEALTDLSLSENVSEIGSNAFEYCTVLEKITLPDSLRNLGAFAFQYCEALTDVELGAGLTVIPKSCFLADRSLETIVCPQQMTKIEADAFKNATSFREITLNWRITSIDSTAFSYPAKLTIYGISGTYPETFAKEQEIAFVPLDCPATAICLNKEQYRLARGDSFQLTVSIIPVNSTDKLIWKSLNEDIVTVSETGLLKGISLGTAKVTATAGAVTVMCEIEVYEKVTGVSLDSLSKTVTAGQSFWLTATVYPKNASDQSVQWKSSDETVVRVGTTGYVTAVSEGTAMIEVITMDGGYRKTCTVTVVEQSEPSATPSASPSTMPEETASPTPTKKPDETVSPTPTKKPEETASPTSTKKPEEIRPTMTPFMNNTPNTTEQKDVNKLQTPSVTITTFTGQSSKVKKPGKVTSMRIKVKNKKLLVSWKRKSNLDGFQIHYAWNKKFTKKKKSKFVGKRTSNTVIKGLKKGKTYYVRVRAYRKSSGKKIYGKWSTVKKCKVK